MLETQCAKIKLRPGSLSQVEEWANELNHRPQEVLQTLRDEGVVIESVFLDSSEQGDFLIYYMKAESFEKARIVAEQSTHAIDAYHSAFKKATFESGQLLRPLIDYERLSE